MSKKTMITRAAIPAAVLLVCSSTVWAQEASPAAAATAATANKLETVKIDGAKQPYKTLSATGAMKSEIAIRDMAQSVRVLSADLLSDAGVTKLAEALDLTSGISKQNNFGGLWDSYAIRGFTGDPNFGSDYMVNGFNSSRGYNGKRETVNTASVEVLKGPASALYGRGEPGGTVNITTKKPLFVPEYAVEMSVGSYGRMRGTADLTGPLSEKLAYRLNYASEKSDSYRDKVQSDSNFVAPSFLWMVSADTTVSYELEYSKQHTTFDRGVVAIRGQLGVVPRSRFLGEPNDGLHAIETTGHQLFIQHYFNDDWSIQTGLSNRESSILGISSEGRFIQADDRTLVRQRRSRDYSATDVSGRFEVLGKVRSGGLQHNLIFGADAYKFTDNRQQYRIATSNPIDIYNPVYGATPPAMSLNTWSRENQDSKSIYAQDQIDLSAQWKVLLGVRYDKYDQSTVKLATNVTVSQQLSATTPRVGVVYQPNKQVSLYATASKSFRPNSGVSSAFKAFPAEQGRSAEVGGKYDSADGKISSTMALYRIAKNNVLTPDPLDPNNFAIAAGEVESKGLEFDLSGEVRPGLRLSAAYAFTDAKVTRDNNLFLVGSQLANVPKQSANLMLVQAFRLAGWAASFGGGINYVGEREGSVAPLTVADNFKLPAYTSVKLIGSLQMGKQWKLSADLDNLFDKTYYTNSYNQAWVLPGNGRKFNLTAQYKF